MVERFHVTYRIDTPQFSAAYLELRSKAVRVATKGVPISLQGEADLNVDNPVDIGPTVKLQVHCPGGDSNWLAVGSLRPPPSSAQPRIENITPDSIESPNSMDMAAGGVDALVQLNLWGAGFGPECTASYRVNDGEPMDARSAFQRKHQMIAYITRRPLYSFSWSSRRYLELLLVVVGKETPGREADEKADIRPIPITGP